MAAEKTTAKQPGGGNADASSRSETSESDPACGVIMPISATSNHDEKHWASVQTLLHRGIRAAGLQPHNVWEGVNDRISKRIVSNIFRQDIVVADISDLNPNVMLEVGLRLASKKPIVIVFEEGGKIPFDIADVGALPYPGDLNILDMEGFFEKFTSLIKERLQAFSAGTYEPYLGDVVVEVLEPQTKEIGIGEAILERLDEFSSRLSRIEKNNANGNRFLRTDRSEPRRQGPTTRVTFSIPRKAVPDVERVFDGVATRYSATGEGHSLRYEVELPSSHTPASVAEFAELVRAQGGAVLDIAIS